jgi:hypothetical protein
MSQATPRPGGSEPILSSERFSVMAAAHDAAPSAHPRPPT